MNRKELMRMMPENKDDAAAAMRIAELGYPAVAPVMRDMVRWMRVAQSPVADSFAEFFAKLGEPALTVIAEGLMRENCWLRHRVFERVLVAWPEALITQLTHVLTMIATQPDPYDNDLRCMAILIEHQLTDPAWLRQWLDFKKERWAERNKLLMQVEQKLNAGS